MWTGWPCVALHGAEHSQANVSTESSSLSAVWTRGRRRRNARGFNSPSEATARAEHLCLSCDGKRRGGGGWSSRGPSLNRRAEVKTQPGRCPWATDLFPTSVTGAPPCHFLSLWSLLHSSVSLAASYKSDTSQPESVFVTLSGYLHCTPATRPPFSPVDLLSASTALPPDLIGVCGHVQHVVFVAGSSELPEGGLFAARPHVTFHYGLPVWYLTGCFLEQSDRLTLEGRSWPTLWEIKKVFAGLWDFHDLCRIQVHYCDMKV